MITDAQAIEIKPGRYQVRGVDENGETVVLSGTHNTREKALRDAANRILNSNPVNAKVKT